MLPDGLPELKSPYPAGHKPEWAGTTWSPTFEVGDNEGEVRSVPHAITDAEPDDASMLAEVGLDSTVWEVVSRRESRWQRHDGEWLQAFKLTVRRRGAGSSDLTADQMSEILKTYRSPRPRAAKASSGTMIVAVADLQAGKIDGGGSAALVDRFGRITADIKQHISERPKLDRLVIAHLGDCVEGLVSQGGKLATRLDLSLTEQIRLYRRLTLHQIAELAPLAERVLVSGVPGNHDETTRQFQTPPTDSFALEAMSAVADAVAMSGKYDHVKFLFPAEDEMTVTFDAGPDKEHPFIVALTHGHLASAPNKVVDWWRGQSHAQQPVGKGRLLMTGHWHSLRVEDSARRTWLQVPSLEGASEYYRRRTGESSAAGMVTLDITGVGRGWTNLKVWE